MIDTDNLEKSNLDSSLWKSCDPHRSGMVASQYKEFILSLLFGKHIPYKGRANRISLIDVPNSASLDNGLGKREAFEQFMGTRLAAIAKRLHLLFELGGRW